MKGWIVLIGLILVSTVAALSDDEMNSDDFTLVTQGESHGSIQVCLTLLDPEGDVTSSYPGHFEITDDYPNQLPDANPVHTIGTTTFDSPFVYNTDVFFDDGINDSYCEGYSDLSMGSYFYSQLDLSEDWSIVGYNDQNIVAVNDFNDVFPYDDALFDGNVANDDSRDTNSDGHIVLHSGRKNRELIIVAQYPGVCEEIEEGDFCTQTQGGWGTSCNGNNPGCMRDEHWDAIVGDYLIVGNGNKIHFTDVDAAANFINFTSSEAIEDFLPSGGTPDNLDNNYTDPLITEAGILAGQVTALKLNVLFSDAGVGLETPQDPGSIGDLIISSGPFAGMSVREFLDYAEIVLGGNEDALDYFGVTYSDVNDAATAINQNFVDCTTNNNYLQRAQCSEYCGDGIINQEFEECDLNDGVGEHQECSLECTLIDLPYCGDNIVNQESEECDGSAPPFYTCTEECLLIPDNLTCVEARQAGLLTATIDEGNVTIHNDAAFSYDVGVAVYKKYDEIIDNQIIYDYDTGVVPAEDELNLSVDLPMCAYQLDVFCGEVLLSLNGSRYDQRIINFTHEGDTYCTDVICGDGVVNQDSEQCDGSDGVGLHQQCNAFCELENLTYCGDGIIQTPNDDGVNETCDGSAGVGQHEVCNDQCELEQLPFCGDGVINQEFEQCDVSDGVGEHQVCTDECTLINLTYCGDGIVQQPNDFGKNETCDGEDGVGEHQECNDICELKELPYCGDGIVNQEWEECDGSAPEGYTCTLQCTLDRDYEIILNHKWNLISVPFTLNDSNPEKVFNHSDILSVWYYDAFTGEWLVFTPNGENDDDLLSIDPGRGYWVLLNASNLTLPLVPKAGPIFPGISNLTEPGVDIPSVVNIKGGAWNMIGYYGIDTDQLHVPAGEGKEANCMLSSLVDGFDKGWVSLYTYWEPNNPSQWIELNQNSQMDPGMGYWIFATSDSVYVPTCF